jgi:hypothetical protein
MVHRSNSGPCLVRENRTGAPLENRQRPFGFGYSRQATHLDCAERLAEIWISPRRHTRWLNRDPDFDWATCLVVWPRSGSCREGTQSGLAETWISSRGRAKWPNRDPDLDETTCLGISRCSGSRRNDMFRHFSVFQISTKRHGVPFGMIWISMEARVAEFGMIWITTDRHAVSLVRDLDLPAGTRSLGFP